MSETNNDNFDGLKRLIKLKQHEVPPPGYFNGFSSDITSRIRAGETGGAISFFERFGTGSLLGNLAQIFQAKPAVVGGFATSLCLLLVFGVIMADRQDGASASSDMAAVQPAVGDVVASAAALLPADPASGISVTTNPVSSLQPVASMFGSQQNPLFQPAGFMPSGQ